MPDNLQFDRAVEADWNRGGSAGRLGKALALGILATIGCAVPWFGGKPASEPDRRALIEYLVLVGALTALTAIHVSVSVLG